MSWVVVIVLYVIGMGIFHVLGGLGAAAAALEQWGRSRAVRSSRVSTSSQG
jgi:hypothetical protein